MQLIRKFFPFNPSPIKIKRNQKKNKFLFVIPPFGMGSGGHLNIFRFSNFLASQGVDIFLYINQDFNYNKSKLLNDVRMYYLEPKFKFIKKNELIKNDFKIIIYSSWDTLYTNVDFKFDGPNYYFVQDFETYFYTHGSLSSVAFNSYFINQNMFFICAGNWVKNKLISSGINANKTISYDFAVDNNTYFNAFRKRKNTKQILFYYRPGTERRMATLGLRAIELLYKKNSNIKIKLIGETNTKIKINFEYEGINFLNPKDLGSLYNSVDVVLVLGATNASLLPLEVLACATPVVMNKGENNDWISKKFKSIYSCENDAYAISNTLEQILIDTNSIKVKQAERDAKKISLIKWDDSYKKVWDWIKAKNDETK